MNLLTRLRTLVLADDSCGDNLFSSPQPVNAQPKGDEKKADEKPAPN